MPKFFVFFLMTLLLPSCTQFPLSDGQDSFLWLEEVESPKALAWVKKQNQKTLTDFTSGKRFKEAEKGVLDILQASDRIPSIHFYENRVFNFWQDKKSVRGLWRETSLSGFMKKKPKWEKILDIDLLAKKEKENWVFQGLQCLPPKNKNCLVFLSRGGKDAHVVREYDTVKKKFVQDGFNLPEAKSHVTWLDKDQILVGTNFGEESLTDSGYPRLIKLWKRGTDFKKAPLVFEGKKTDMGIYSVVLRHKESQVSLILRKESFFTSLYWIYEKGKLKSIPVQKTAEIVGLSHGHLIFSLKESWSVSGKTFPRGSVVALNKEFLVNQVSPVTKKSSKPGEPAVMTFSKQETPIPKGQIQLIYSPDKKSALWRVAATKNRLLINVLENVRGRVLQVQFSGGQFSKAKPMDLDPKAHWSLKASHYNSSDFFVMKQDYLTPNSLFFYKSSKNKFQEVKSLPPRFNSESMVVLQKWAKSKDGTMIPYSLIGKKSVLEKGHAPTLLYGYGGFEVSLTPRYMGSVGKFWLEKGGLYAVANIRGGGEFGPDWHRLAQKTNRHKAYDDFIAVAENLIENKVTGKDKLAIKGASNGGLLVGAVMTRRPDLLKAVVCQVPLLDMIRYSQLLAGASWMEEYGNPKDSKMRKYLLSYSPYQNVKEKEKYPELFMLTSTKDDRVHPGHARKMTAKMQQLGHKNLYYYENIEGGHGAAANQKQKAKMSALIFEFLYRKLMD